MKNKKDKWLSREVKEIKCLDLQDDNGKFGVNIYTNKDGYIEVKIKCGYDGKWRLFHFKDEGEE